MTFFVVYPAGHPAHVGNCFSCRAHRALPLLSYVGIKCKSSFGLMNDLYNSQNNIDSKERTIGAIIIFSHTESSEIILTTYTEKLSYLNFIKDSRKYNAEK